MADIATIAKQQPQFEASLILSGAGAQGKSLTAEALVLTSLAGQRSVRAISADVQEKLALKLGPDRVASIDIDVLNMFEDDPLVLLRTFSPVLDATDLCSADGADLVMDTAATWHRVTLRWSAEVNFDKFVAAKGGRLNVLLVSTAQRDGLRMLIETTEAARIALPDARLIWVANDRNGDVDFDRIEWEAVGIDPERANALREFVSVARIPRLHDDIWQPLDRSGLSMQAAVEKDASDLRTCWPDRNGKPLDRVSAQAVQRKVVVWVGAILQQFSAVLGFSVA